MNGHNGSWSSSFYSGQYMPVDTTPAENSKGDRRATAAADGSPLPPPAAVPPHAAAEVRAAGERAEADSSCGGAEWRRPPRAAARRPRQSAASIASPAACSWLEIRWRMLERATRSRQAAEKHKDQ